MSAADSLQIFLRDKESRK